MKKNRINDDKIYEKAKKIRTKLLLYTDRELKNKSKKDMNKRYIKQYNIENHHSFGISYQEYYSNHLSKKIKIISSFDKEGIPNPDTSLVSISKSNISKILTNSSNSSLPTQEQSFKNKLTISKLILHKKVIPENLINLIEKNKKLKINKSICYCTKNIYNTFNDVFYNDEDNYKYYEYLEDLCCNIKINYL